MIDENMDIEQLIKKEGELYRDIQQNEAELCRLEDDRRECRRIIVNKLTVRGKETEDLLEEYSERCKLG